MNWVGEHLFALITTGLAIFGGATALLQWRKSINLQQAKFVEQIFEKLHFNKDMEKAIHFIEYTEGWYKEGFHDSDDERMVNIYLTYTLYICYLLDEGHITPAEEELLSYVFHRIFSSRDVCAYLWNFKYFCEAHGRDCSFQKIIDYGIKRKYINEADFIRQQNKYPKLLMFCRCAEQTLTCDKDEDGKCPYITSPLTCEVPPLVRKKQN